MPISKEPSVERIELSKALANFVAHCRTEGKRRKTITKYDGIVKKFIAFAKEKERSLVNDVRLPLIDAYRNDASARLSPVSMSNEVGHLKRFFDWCKKRSYLTDNPLADTKVSVPATKKKHSPTLQQVDAILRAASDHHRPILATLAFIGARSGEIRNLRVEDVDFAGNWIQIVSRRGAETKSGRSRKTPIHPRLRAVLEKLPKKSSGYFFTALPCGRYPEGSHHINPKHLNDSLKVVLKRLKLPVGRVDGFTVHSLRRFFRTTAVNASVPERVVDIWIGHEADRRAVQTIYYELSDKDSQEFIKKVPFGDGNTAADVREGGAK